MEARSLGVLLSALILFSNVSCRQKDNAQTPSPTYLKAGDVKKAIHPNGAEVTVMASETGVVVKVSRKEKPLETILFDQDKLTLSTFYTDQNGVTWEVLDLKGTGVPDYRISRSGPRISEKFSGGSFQKSEER